MAEVWVVEKSTVHGGMLVNVNVREREFRIKDMLLIGTQ